MEEHPFSHLDGSGKARMVDVGAKKVTHRVAVAEGYIKMPAPLIEKMTNLPKGNAFDVARLAGIMAAKKTGDLIPLCHPLGLDQADLEFEPQPEQARVRVQATTRCHGKTGVEMEAMTAVSTALLTLYDMAKSAEKGMEIHGIRLLYKAGGKSGEWNAS